MGSLAWKFLGAGSAVIATAVADRGVHALWRTATGEEPPLSPENPDTDWSDALAWALLSGVGIAVVRLVVTRRMAEYYRHSTGHLPTPLANPKGRRAST